MARGHSAWLLCRAAPRRCGALAVVKHRPGRGRADDPVLSAKDVEKREEKEAAGSANPSRPETYLLNLPVGSKNADAPLFPALSRKKVEGRIGLSNTFTRLIASAGIDNEILSEGKGSKGRSVKRLSFHSLRHTFVSQMANMGVAREVRRKLAGHSRKGSHDRYTHLEIGTIRAALKDFPLLVPAGKTSKRRSRPDKKQIPEAPLEGHADGR